MTDTTAEQHTHPLVLVEWLDSRGCHDDWHTADHAYQTPCRCESVGWLIHDGPDAMTVAPHQANEHEGFCGDMTIPRQAVHRVVDLSERGSRQKNLIDLHKPACTSCGHPITEPGVAVTDKDSGKTWCERCWRSQVKPTHCAGCSSEIPPGHIAIMPDQSRPKVVYHPECRPMQGEQQADTHEGK